MKASSYAIGYDPTKGRGVYATRPIKKGETVFVCHLLIFNKKDTAKIQTTVLNSYVFAFDDKRACLPLGVGVLMNHSNNPTVSYKLIEKAGTNVFRFFAKRDIAKGEELCHHYGYQPTPFQKHRIRRQVNKNVKDAAEGVHIFKERR